jgi:hypothetical protein
MSSDIKQQLRALAKAEWMIGYGADGNVAKAADVIEALEGQLDAWSDKYAETQAREYAAHDKVEALEGEVALLKELLGFKVNLTAEMVELHKEKKAAEAEVARLREAVTPFASIKADDGDTFDTWDDQVVIRCEITVRDMRKAREALEGK